jgi:hypothetical protein
MRRKSQRNGKKGVATMMVAVVFVRNARKESTVQADRTRKSSKSRPVILYSSAEEGVLGVHSSKRRSLTF